MAGNRTLWEEGRTPSRLVAWAAAVTALLAVLIDVAVQGRLGLVFDLAFVVICLAAALAVRPTEFFSIGVMPPLLMGGTVLALAVVDRTTVAERDDPLVQAVVSGLAHHATALVVGYGLTLVVLGLRQVAMRNAGRLRGTGVPAQRVASDVPSQRQRRAVP